MKLIVLCLLATLAVSALGYPRHRLHHHQYGQADLKFKGTIFFEGCYEKTCRNDHYRGYDCHDGYCIRVCDSQTCWKQDPKMFVGKVKVHGDIFFDGCYEETCHKDHFFGFQCHEGYCKHVCDGTTCWEPELKSFSGKARIQGEVIFDGCFEETCHKGKFHGYKCFDGHCHHICDDVHCWEPEVNTFKGKAHFKGVVYFDGCYEETCHKDHFYGFQCHEGYCKHVCDGTTCWEPELKSFSGKARIQGEVIFDGCFEETCHKGKFHGYKCLDGHCHHICDDVHCWEPEVNAFKGKAHFKGVVYFDGCYEETCHKDHFYGFQCHEGYCKHVCDGTTCWEPELKSFSGKARIQGEVIFDGCFEETCHKGKFHGYKCFDGHCHHICDDVHCWEPEVNAFKGKAHFKGVVYFDGCYEDTCHKDHFYGFQCHEGYCKHVCDGTTCWEPELKSFSGKAKIQGEVIFDGCFEETCHKGKFHGYKCFDGHCHHICDDVHCWEPEINMFKGKAHVEGEIIFEGCYEDTCHKGAYEGHNCHHGHCLEVCDFDSCWQQMPKTISGKAHFKGEIFFDGCFEETCHQFDFHGYKCHQGHCGIICDGNSCWNSEVATFAGKAKVRGEIVFDGCVEEICHKDHYDGYFCNRGHCGYVCHDDDCFSQDEYISDSLFEEYDVLEFDDGYHYNFHY